MMKKNIFLLSFSFLLSLFLGACSSGSSRSDTPPNLSGGAFVGTYQSSQNTDSGNITFNLTQNGTDITGLIIITSNNATCLRTGVVEGTITGFNINLEIEQTASTTVGTATTTGGGTLNMALNATNNSLSGNYTVIGTTNGNCSVETSTGTVNASR